MEVRRKLSERGFDNEAICDTLDRLRAASYIDDARYADLFAEQRCRRGYGPRAIRARLRERGIDEYEAARAVAALNVSWSEQAFVAMQRHFHAHELDDNSDRQRGRIARFLTARGFATTDVLEALRELQRQRLQ